MKRGNKESALKVPALPDLEHAENAVLNSLESLQSRRSYEHAMTEFVEWYAQQRGLHSIAQLFFSIGCFWRRGTWHPQPSMSGLRRSGDWHMKRPTAAFSVPTR